MSDDFKITMLYSKYSPECTSLLQRIQQTNLPNFSTLCIDNALTRHKMIGLLKLKYVPAIILYSDNDFQVFDGINIVGWIDAYITEQIAKQGLKQGLNQGLTHTLQPLSQPVSTLSQPLSQPVPTLSQPLSQPVSTLSQPVSTLSQPVPTLSQPLLQPLSQSLTQSSTQLATTTSVADAVQMGVQSAVAATESVKSRKEDARSAIARMEAERAQQLGSMEKMYKPV